MTADDHQRDIRTRALQAAEDHSPYCHRDCDHPCHDPYDRWVAENRSEETP